MHSFHEIAGSYKGLRAALATLLAGQEPTLIVLSEIDYPLLILETSSDLAGFATLNGKPEHTYPEAYAAFKDLYRKNHDSWQDRNLSFVLCRSELRPSDDAFFSKTETDVYFCRKYVIALRSEEGEQIRELQRLPFLPLRESQVGGVTRPPSAQALLQSANLDTGLAADIVVDYAPSASRILEDVLAGQRVLPPEVAVDSWAKPEVLQQPPATERTRVSSIAIEAFRAYRKRQEFDLDADLVVLYGPNGLGKTSFFDAIDYVCTGRIGRLCSHRRISLDRFVDLARHLDSSPEDSSVSLRVRLGDSTSTVTRNLEDRNNALLDGKPLKRADILQFLTSARWGERRAHIANLERLFRATHLFSQSAPELLIEFEEDSAIPFELVSRMLALDDYAAAVTKTEAIQDLVNRRASEILRDVAALEERVEQIQSRIRELPEPETATGAGANIRREAKELARELEEQLALPIADFDPTAELAREWRAMVEASVQEGREMLRRTREAESGHPQFEKSTQTLEDARTKLPQMEAALEKGASEQEKKRKQRSQLMHSVEKEQSELTLAVARVHALKEFAELREVYQEAITSLRSRRQELKLAIGKAQATNDELRTLAPNADSLRARFAEQQEGNQSCLVKMSRLSAIQEELASWQRNTQQVANLQRRADKLESDTSAINEKVGALKEEIEKQEKELASRDKEYRLASADQTELAHLLDEIETHVSDRTCPVCGTEHTTRAALIKRIHARKEARPAHVEKLADGRAQLRGALEKARTSLSEHTRERGSKLSELAGTTGTLAQIRASISAFELQASEAGLAASEDLPDTLADQLARTTETHDATEEAQKRLESELGKVVERITSLEQEEKAQVAIRERSESAISSLEEQISGLQAKADELRVPLEIEADELVEERDAAATREVEVRQRVEEFEKMDQAIAQAIDEEDVVLGELNDATKALRLEVEQLDREVELYRESASKALVDRDEITLEAIRRRRKHLEERIERLQTIARRCIALERSLDAAQRSAMLAELALQAESLVKERQSLLELSERISKAREVFADVKSVLDGQSSQAVANYVEALGPLTTLIQKRLRAAYGFGDIGLRAKGNEIQVVVGWKDQDVKPGDYFSDSQKQILMLSLFLAGRLTQTWSGFSPILMDDPVTHFDDLNAFGFVELVRGLAASSPGRRQFFISTCDDRLFGLMRSKFRDLPGGVRFYEFEGIGRDGPVVNRVDARNRVGASGDSDRASLPEADDKDTRVKDSRTTGVSFSGPGDVTIHGDVVGGDQKKKQ